MLSCLQRPRSGRWRALISLHTQRLRSITSSSLPSRSLSRAGWGCRGSGSGSAGWVCAPSSHRRPDGGERKKEGQGPRSDWALSPLRRPVPSPRNKSSPDPVLSPLSRWEQKSSPCTLCPAVHHGARLGLFHPEEGALFKNCLPSRMHFSRGPPRGDAFFYMHKGALLTSGGPAWLAHHKQPWFPGSFPGKGSSGESP